MWKISGLFRCENSQACLGVKNFRPVWGVKISGLKFSGVKFFNPPNLAQFQPNLHVKILVWSHVKISGLKLVWFTCENRCDRFGTGQITRTGVPFRNVVIDYFSPTHFIFHRRAILTSFKEHKAQCHDTAAFRNVMLLGTSWRQNILGAKWRCKNVVSPRRRDT